MLKCLLDFNVQLLLICCKNSHAAKSKKPCWWKSPMYETICQKVTGPLFIHESQCNGIRYICQALGGQGWLIVTKAPGVLWYVFSGLIALWIEPPSPRDPPLSKIQSDLLTRAAVGSSCRRWLEVGQMPGQHLRCRPGIVPPSSHRFGMICYWWQIGSRCVSDKLTSLVLLVTLSLLDYYVFIYFKTCSFWHDWWSLSSNYTCAFLLSSVVSKKYTHWCTEQFLMPMFMPVHFPIQSYYLLPKLYLMHFFIPKKHSIKYMLAI